MKKFRKKPVVIEAEKWLGTVEQKESLLAEGVIIEIPSQDGSCLVPTMEGNLTCRVNDYIVKDSDGKYSVCDAETFKATYEVDAKKSVEYAGVKSLSDAIDIAMTGEVISDNTNTDVDAEVPVTEALTIAKIRDKKVKN